MFSRLLTGCGANGNHLRTVWLPHHFRLLRRSRPFSTSPCPRLLHSIPGPLLPPVVFVGLALTLWAYKCVMMVIFQNRIIYMPSMPPFSRSERIEDYVTQCRGVQWKQRRIRTADGVDIALCVGGISCGMPRTANNITKRKHVVILYFQGNGSSIPPRLPLLSAILKKLEHHGASTATDFTIVALSYRGFWTSRGRPSQKGIELDAIAALQWVQDTYPVGRNNGDGERDVSYVLWGQSIGAGVATGLVAHHARDIQHAREIHGMILETPFLSIKSMLMAMYPQRWLPYRYLWPFLRNWWDSDDALQCIGRAATDNTTSKTGPSVAKDTRADRYPSIRGGGKLGSSDGAWTTSSDFNWPRNLAIFIISAANDELVPPNQAVVLEELCHSVGLTGVTRFQVPGALHSTATVKQKGQDAIVGFLKKVSESM